MIVKVTKTYLDLRLRRVVLQGEQLEVTKERAEELMRLGVIEIVAEQMPLEEVAKKQEELKPKKKKATKKAQ